MKWVDPREQKRSQVRKTALVALFSDIFTLYIILTAPVGGAIALFEYVLLLDPSLNPYGVHTFFVPVVSIISTVYTRIELLEYRKGRYRIWPD